MANSNQPQKLIISCMCSGLKRFQKHSDHVLTITEKHNCVTLLKEPDGSQLPVQPEARMALLTTLEFNFLEAEEPFSMRTWISLLPLPRMSFSSSPRLQIKHYHSHPFNFAVKDRLPWITCSQQQSWSSLLSAGNRPTSPATGWVMWYSMIQSQFSKPLDQSVFPLNFSPTGAGRLNLTLLSDRDSGV